MFNKDLNCRLSLDLPNHNWLINKIEKKSLEKPKRSVVDDSIPLQLLLKSPEDTVGKTYLNKKMSEEANGIYKSSNCQAYNDLVPQYFRSFVSVNANQAKVNLEDENSESALNNSEGLFTYNKDNNSSILNNDKDKSTRQIKHFVPDINYQLQPRYNYVMNVPEHESIGNNNDFSFPKQDSYNIEEPVPLNLKINHNSVSLENETVKYMTPPLNDTYKIHRTYKKSSKNNSKISNVQDIECHQCVRSSSEVSSDEKLNNNCLQHPTIPHKHENLKVIDCSHQSHMNTNRKRLHASRSKKKSTVSSDLKKSKTKTITESLIKKSFSNIKKLIKDVKKIENLVMTKQNTIITIDLTKDDDEFYNDIIEKSKMYKFFLDSIFKNKKLHKIISGMDPIHKNKFLTNLYKKFNELYTESMKTGEDNMIDEILNTSTDIVVAPTKKVGVNHVLPDASMEPLNLIKSHLSTALPRESTQSLQRQLTPPIFTSQNVQTTSQLQQQNFPILASHLSQPKPKNPIVTSAHSNYSISSLAGPTSSHLTQLPISTPLHQYYSYNQPLQHQSHLMSTLPQTNYLNSTRLYPEHLHRPWDPQTLEHSLPPLSSSLAQHHLPTVMPEYNSPLYQQMQTYPVNSLYPYNYTTIQGNAAIYPRSHWARN